MTKERACEIAMNHSKYNIGDVSYYKLADGRNLHIQTLYEPLYYIDDDYVTYIDTENDDGDCMETHTAHMNDIDDIAHWIHEMCYSTEEVSE